MANPNFHKIKKMAFGPLLTKIKYAYMWDENSSQFVRVWSGASEVTLIIDGSVIETLEVEDGENIISHLTTPTVPQDSKFVGWTDDNTNTTPKQSIIADGDPKTIYGIYKYNDKTLCTNVGLGWGNGGFHYQDSRQSFCSIDGNKYASVRIQAREYSSDVAGWATANSMALYVGVNGSSENWVYTQHQSGGIGVDGDHRYITSSGGYIDTNISVPKTQTYAYGRLVGDCYETHISGTVTGYGRTYVG